MIHKEIRDDKGEWQPEKLPVPSPLFQWPPNPKRILRYCFGLGGLLFPYNAAYLLLGVLCWRYLTPGVEYTKHFSFGWIALLYLRNAALLTLLCGGMHLRLYVKRGQGTHYKYNEKWMATGDKRFLFKNQTWDNVFLSLISGVTVWTLYEALTLWAYAHELIPRVSWREHPVYCTLLLVGVVFLRETHFYWIHRMLHWGPLMRKIHFRHHRNVNIGPWSGMSMHPIEHLVYFSGVFLHWIIPSHPIHAIAHLMHAGLSPAKGHAGFYKFVVQPETELKRERALHAGGYFHYLHHRFFTVNFGNETVPLDTWFGSAHDGSDEAHAAMLERRRRKKKIRPAETRPG